MANTWILIRHPDKEGDAEGVYLGDTARITDRGQQQIALVVSRLRLLFPDAITCSLFPRAQILAKRIAEDLKVPEPVQHSLFNEIDKPQFLIGKKRKDPEHERVMQAIRDQFDDDTVPTDLLRGEVVKTRSQLEEDIRRAIAFIEHFQSSGSIVAPNTVLTVSHAKKIAAIVHYVYRNGTLEGYYREADRHLKISTTGITILSRESDRRTGEMHWHLKTVNEEAHTQIGFEEQLRSIISSVT